MKKIIQFLGKVLLVLVALFLLVAVTVTLMFYLIDPIHYKGYLTEKLKEETGVKLVVGGQLKIQILPLPRIHLDDVLLDVPFEGQNLKVKAKTFDMKLTVLSYLQKDLALRKVYLKDAEISLQKGKEAQGLSVKEATLKLEFGDKQLQVPSFHLETEDGVFYGNLDFNWSKKPIKIKGVIHSDYIVLSPAAPKDRDKKVIPNVELSFGGINEAEFDLHLELKSVALGNTTFKNVKLDLKNKEDALFLSPLSLEVYEGTVSGDIRLYPTPHDSVKVEADLEGRQMSLEAFYKHENRENLMKGGLFNARFKGRGVGRNLQGLLGDWTGSFEWVLGDTVLYNQTIQSNLSDMVFSLVGFFNPRAKQDNNTYLQCAAAKFNIHNGVAKAPQGLGIETKQFDILGSGDINLKNEHINFEFNLRKKHGIELPFTSFDQYLRLNGTLGEPTVSFNPKGVVKGGASILSAVATGGLSLVAEQVFKGLGDKGHPCEVVFKNKPKS